MQKLLIVAAALIAASCGTATAQNASGQGGGEHNMMAQADTNHDGKISRAEFLAARDARFAQMDANHDGSLQASERPHWQQGGAQTASAAGGGHGNHGDANGDGVVSKAEYDAQAGHQFDRADANHDGFIDAAEMQAMHDHRHQGGQDQN